MIKKLRLEADLPEESFGIEIETDRSALKLVLVNLVGNALEYTQEGGVTVRIVTDDEHAAPVALEVSDTGPGIPEQSADLIFKAFERLPAIGAGADGVESTGLGLSISRALCDLMGFELRLRTEEGAGSTFSVVFA